jgi:Na+/melibiose symporter-like transporter
LFDVAYITAIPNLVERDQITEANSRLQTTYALASILGLTLSGFVSAQYGATFAIGIDALSFALSALLLLAVRLRPATIPAETAQTSRSKSTFNGREFLAGAAFLWRQPVLRPVTVFLACLTLLTAGAFDLFVFHLKHDLGQSNATIGLIVGLASIGSIIGGLLLPVLRKRLGFGPCWIGGWIIHALCLALIALTPNLVLCSLFTIVLTCSLTIAEISSMSLRQQITPDAILGRVTSVFWMLHSAPAPLGAALFTAISAYTGAVPVLVFIGAAGILTMLIALLTPARQRFPERA